MVLAFFTLSIFDSADRRDGEEVEQLWAAIAYPVDERLRSRGDCVGRGGDGMRNDDGDMGSYKVDKN